MTTSDRPGRADPAQTEGSTQDQDRDQDQDQDQDQTQAEHDSARQAELVASRAQLLAEEQPLGSDDPSRQAEILLEDSEIRTEVPNAAPATDLERRTSEQAT